MSAALADKTQLLMLSEVSVSVYCVPCGEDCCTVEHEQGTKRLVATLTSFDSKTNCLLNLKMKSIRLLT